ncbi:Eukaryotic translation initiation factor 5A [Entamoeba marina]
MSSDNDFEKGNAESSGVIPMQCSALRKNGYTGKHGHAKVTYAGNDIFTGKRYEDAAPSTHNVEVPEVKRTEYPLVGVVDGYCTLLQENGDIREDLKVPAEQFDDGMELMVAVLSSMGTEQIVDAKEAKN